MLKTCFVIQKFDSGVYDKRYRETFAPAIERAGAKPIRADEVLGTRPIVEKIEEGLKSADVVFAEISEDNPNVFLELGIALALTVPAVIVCDRAQRIRLPFDIAHRPVIFYSTDAQSDYEKVAREVENGIQAALLEAHAAADFESVPAVTSGIDVDDVKGACLIALLDRGLRSPLGSTLWEIQKEVASAGISDRMVALATMSLFHDGLFEQINSEDNNGEPYLGYRLTESGNKYLLRSYSALMNQERERLRPRVPPPTRRGFDDIDEDVPF